MSQSLRRRARRAGLESSACLNGRARPRPRWPLCTPTVSGSGESGSTAPPHELALEVGKKEQRERERKREGAGGLPLSGDFGRRGSGSHRRDPSPASAAVQDGCALLVEECPRGRGSSAGVRGREEEEQWQGRQRLHTRLYPVEISRALKSSESMLPVCFCSQDAGIAGEPGPE